MNSPRIPRAGITVIGSGTASAVVDRVTISLAVEAIRAEPGDAFGNASETATRLLSILADGGVDSRSVRTSDITLGPRIEYNNGRQPVQGYQASQRLTVIREGLHGIERLLTDVASLGGEGVRIDGVSLTPGHPAEAMRLARSSRFADATAKAQQLAALAGRPRASSSGSTKEPRAAVGVHSRGRCGPWSPRRCRLPPEMRKSASA